MRCASWGKVEQRSHCTQRKADDIAPTTLRRPDERRGLGLQREPARLVVARARRDVAGDLVIIELAQGKTGFIRPKIVPYLRDLHDELTRIEELAVCGEGVAPARSRLESDASSPLPAGEASAAGAADVPALSVSLSLS